MSLFAVVHDSTQIEIKKVALADTLRYFRFIIFTYHIRNPLRCSEFIEYE